MIHRAPAGSAACLPFSGLSHIHWSSSTCPHGDHTPERDRTPPHRQQGTGNKAPAGAGQASVSKSARCSSTKASTTSSAATGEPRTRPCVPLLNPKKIQRIGEPLLRKSNVSADQGLQPTCRSRPSTCRRRGQRRPSAPCAWPGCASLRCACSPAHNCYRFLGLGLRHYSQLLSVMKNNNNTEAFYQSRRPSSF